MKKAMIALSLGVLVLASCASGPEADGKTGGTGGAAGPSQGADAAAATGGVIATSQATGGGGPGSATSSGVSAVGGSIATNGKTTNTGGQVTGGQATGGSGGSATGYDLPSCPPREGVGALACGLLVTLGEGSGTVLDTNLTAEVSVKEVASAANNSLCYGQRLSLAADDGRTWTMDLNVTGLPKDFLRTGDKLGLTVASWAGGGSYSGPTVSQSLVITRDGKTILTTWTGTVKAMSDRDPPGTGVPGTVNIAGLNLTSDGMICLGYELSCWTRHHRALVTVGSSSARVEPLQSVKVGGLQIVLETFREVTGGMCDQLGELTFAAFSP